MTLAPRRWMSHCVAFVGLLVVALALLLGPASPASAHAVLVSTSPVRDSVLTNAPSEIVLTFSESVREVPDKIRVIGPNGARVDRGKPIFDGAVVTIPVDPDGPRGTYLISYRVISNDSHPVGSAFTYSVGAPSEPPVDSDDGRSDPVVTAAVPTAKYLGYAGLVLLVGPGLVLSLLWPRRLSRRGPARLVWVGVGLVAVATLAGLWLQVPYTNGGGIFAVTSTAFGDVLASTFGTVHLARLGLLIVGVLLLRAPLRGEPGRVNRILLAVLGLAGLATWPLAGHAAASPLVPVSVVADMAHLASMAVWLGGLVMLVGFLLRRANDRELDAILPIWSRWAGIAVFVLLLGGTVQALIEVATPAALVSTPYGRLITVKVLLFSLVMAVAAYSRQLVHRRFAPEPDGADADDAEADGVEADGVEVDADNEGEAGSATGRGPGGLRRMIWVELAIAAVVLALSATLVQTPPARTAMNNTEGGLDGFYAITLTSSIYSLEVTVDPLTVGSNSIHLYAYTLDNKPLPVIEWKATAALPDKGIEPLDIPLLKFTDSHVFGEISLPSPGEWQLRLTLRISEFDQATVTTTVPIT